jgi:hypothetical protein
LEFLGAVSRTSSLSRCPYPKTALDPERAEQSPQPGAIAAGRVSLHCTPEDRVVGRFERDAIAADAVTRAA